MIMAVWKFVSDECRCNHLQAIVDFAIDLHLAAGLHSNISIIRLQ
jgi:hypothetical protein